MVSLELVSQNMGQIEHKINTKAFQNFAKSNNFIWKKLNQLHFKSSTMEECNEDNLQKRTYFLIPLMYVDEDKSELEIDYECIQRICIGAQGRLNGKEWITKMKPSSLKHELIEIKAFSFGNKNKLCISHGIHKKRYKENKQRKQNSQKDKPKTRNGIEEKEDSQSMISDKEWETRSVKSFCNESVVNRWSAMRAAGRRKLNDTPCNLDKNVILAMTEDPFIQVKFRLNHR